MTLLITSVVGAVRMPVTALAMPSVFAEFLAKELGLDTSDDPPAQLGIWMQSYHPLTSMVDPQELRMLPGSSPSNWFMGWAYAQWPCLK
jgi:hypothetical protein